MSDSNEAKIVVTTNYDTFKEFLDFGKKGLADFSGKGKSAFGDLNKEVKGAMGQISGSFVAMGAEFSRAVASKMAPGLDEMIAKAEKLRGIVGGISVSTGQSEGTVRQMVQQSAERAGVPFERLETFAQAFRRQTGDIRAGIEIAPVARDAGLRPGRGLEEMAGLSAELYNRLGLRTAETQRNFFNALSGSARTMGVPEERAFLAFERSASTLGRTSSDPRQLAGFVAALARDRDPSEVAETIGRYYGFAASRYPTKLEGELRARGRLGRGEQLHDARGRIDLMRALDLMETDIRASGRSMERIGIDQLGGAPGRADFLRLREFLRGAGEAARGTDRDLIGEDRKSWERTEEGREWRKQETKRKQEAETGKHLLRETERIIDFIPGGRRGDMVGRAARSLVEAKVPESVPVLGGLSLPGAVLFSKELAGAAGTATYDAIRPSAEGEQGGGGDANKAQAEANAAAIKQGPPIRVQIVGPAGPPTPPGAQGGQQ